MPKELYRDAEFELDQVTENEDDLEISADQFENLLVSPSDWTVGTIYKQIGNQIDLDPDFQRRDVWSTASKSKFIESLLLGIPIPQILLSVKKDRKGSYIVLDGKQRLLTIKEFISGKTIDERVFKLRGLRILKQYEGKSWNDLRADTELENQFLNETVRTTIVKNWISQAVLYEIFYRLNSGSVRLSPMELRMSLFPGPFLKWVVKWSEEISSLHELLRRKRPDKRMADVEIAVRHLAFNSGIIPYSGKLKEYLDEYCEYANLNFDEIGNNISASLEQMNRAIDLGMSIFPDHTFCRKFTNDGYESRFNRALFDVLVGSLQNHKFYEFASKNMAEVRTAYERLCLEDDDFVRSVETSTKNIEPTRTRFRSWYKVAQDISSVDLVIPLIKE